MKEINSLTLLLLTLLLASCAGGPDHETSPKSQSEVLLKTQEIQQENQRTSSSVAPQESKSIVPDINEEGRRGDIARKMLERSSATFLKADENRDYRISLAEATKHIPHIGRDFARYDKNNDDGVSWEEFTGHDKWPAPEHTSSGR